LWCDHDYLRWGGHNTPLRKFFHFPRRALHTGFSHRVGAFSLLGSGPSLCPALMP
jgi:hypothetical protein